MGRNIILLGSTGSIGTQTLDVIRENPDLFQVEALTCNNRIELRFCIGMAPEGRTANRNSKTHSFVQGRSDEETLA